MIFDWAYNLFIGFLTFLADSLPEASAEISPSPLGTTSIPTFLANIGYYVDLVPIMIILTLVGLFFGGFLIWKIVLFLYNLIPVLR